MIVGRLSELFRRFSKIFLVTLLRYVRQQLDYTIMFFQQGDKNGLDFFVIASTKFNV
jgi:hypothetical protein